MTSMETTLFIIQALYFSFKLLVELLNAIGLLDRITAMFNIIFTYNAQPPVNNSDNDNDNANGEQDDAAVVLEDIDDEVAPEQDKTSAISVSSSNGSYIV